MSALHSLAQYDDAPGLYRNGSVESRATGCWLQQGRVLHLQHGPSDVLVSVDADTDYARIAACQAAADAFEPVLRRLVANLGWLRREVDLLSAGETNGEWQLSPDQATAPCQVSRRMLLAAGRFAEQRVTPMAAVAGATADHLLEAIVQQPGIRKAWVNNGGDIAFALTPGQQMDCGIVSRLDDPAVESSVTIECTDTVRGIATSGRAISGQGGRSFSLGIADAVTVLAENAAIADVAATLVANRVDLPGHPGITRVAACELDPDSDLGERPIVTAVNGVSEPQMVCALRRAAGYARELVQSGLISAVALSLGDYRCRVDNNGEVLQRTAATGCITECHDSGHQIPAGAG